MSRDTHEECPATPHGTADAGFAPKQGRLGEVAGDAP